MHARVIRESQQLCIPLPHQLHPRTHMQHAGTRLKQQHRQRRRRAMVKETVVLDLGSALVKCGFAGESAPRCILPSPLDAWHAQALGEGWGVEQWEERLGPYLTDLYLRHLRCRPKDRNVVVVEPLAGPAPFREALAQVLFHWVKAPALLLTPSLPAALLTTGADGGLVVDVGYRETHVLAVAHGRPLLHTYQVAAVGAYHVVSRVQEALEAAQRRQQGGGADDDKERISLEVATDIVTRACFVQSKAQAERPPRVTSLEYDGTDSGGDTIDIPADLRGGAAEALFGEGEDEASVPGAVLRCLKKCPLDLRRAMAGHILAIGGGAMLPGFGKRLAEEVRHQANRKGRYQELVPVLGSLDEASSLSSSPSLCVIKDAAMLCPRNIVAWTGGSILAVLEETVSGGGTRSFASSSFSSSSSSSSSLSRILLRDDYLARQEVRARGQGQGGGGGGQSKQERPQGGGRRGILHEWMAVDDGGSQ